MNKWAKKAQDIFQEDYEKYCSRAIASGCQKCDCKIVQTARRKFQCSGCKTRYGIKAITQWFTDPFDTSKRSKKCDECGGRSPYYGSSSGGGAYICNRCGECYEV